MADLVSEHWKITSAGWSYRMNDRGWVIYRDPLTARWYTRDQAIAILESRKCSAVAA